MFYKDLCLVKSQFLFAPDVPMVSVLTIIEVEFMIHDIVWLYVYFNGASKSNRAL